MAALLERDAELERIEALPEPLLDGPLDGAARLAAPALGLGGEQAAERYAVIHGLYWLTANLAAERPLLLLVDDLQWADPPSQSFLASLACRLDGVAAGPVAALRPPGPGEDRALVDALPGEPLRPAPLTLTAVSALAEAKHGSSGRASECHAATGGNPLWVHAVLDHGRLEQARAAGQLSRVGILLLMRAWCALERGSLEAAEADFALSLELATELEYPTAPIASMLALTVAERGRLDEAGGLLLDHGREGELFENRHVTFAPPECRGQGPAAAYATALWLRSAYADLRWEFHALVREADLVVARCTMSAGASATSSSTARTGARSGCSRPPAARSRRRRCTGSGSPTARSSSTGRIRTRAPASGAPRGARPRSAPRPGAACPRRAACRRSARRWECHPVRTRPAR